MPFTLLAIIIAFCCLSSSIIIIASFLAMLVKTTWRRRQCMPWFSVDLSPWLSWWRIARHCSAFCLRAKTIAATTTIRTMQQQGQNSLLFTTYRSCLDWEHSWDVTLVYNLPWNMRAKKANAAVMTSTMARRCNIYGKVLPCGYDVVSLFLPDYIVSWNMA